MADSIEYPSWQERFQQQTGVHPSTLGLDTEDAAQAHLMSRKGINGPSARRKPGAFESAASAIAGVFARDAHGIEPTGTMRPWPTRNDQER